MKFLQQLNILPENEGTSTGGKWFSSRNAVLESFSPVDGKLIASVISTDTAGYETGVKSAQKAFVEWLLWPPPPRCAVVRQIGESLIRNKQALAQLASDARAQNVQE